MTLFNSLNPKELQAWQDVYVFLANLCQANRHKAGAAFEQFCKAYFLFEPTIKDQYKNVWHGQDAPLRVLRKLNLGIAEHGRDLVLEDKEGLFSLVQCKFKTDQDEILSWSKDKIANLFAEADKSDFVIVFTNASGLDRYSREKKATQLKLITIGDLVQIQPEILRQMVTFLQGRPSKSKAVYVTPRADQTTAVQRVLEGYRTITRGQLILPCGSGKTLTSLWIKEAINPNHTLVIVPSLALLRQFKNEWSRNQKKWQPYLCVCSEKDIDKTGDIVDVHAYEIGGRVTTSAEEIRAFLHKHSKTIIYATYQSLGAIKQALRGATFKFDFAICDEAHKTAGALSTEFAQIHRDANIPVKRRLYMTATPRIRSRKVKLKEDEEELIADMSNPGIYGPIFYRMSFNEAIGLGILVDYKIIAVGVSDAEIQQAILKRRFADDRGETIEDYANNYALQKLMQKYPATHAITFHSTVKRADRFKERHRYLAPEVYSEHVSGIQTTNTRNLIMEDFKNAEKGVVTNARCLTEGIDVPVIDAVYFCDPKNSIIDIVQASGRALRKAKHKDKQLGYIVVPIYHRDRENLESSIQASPHKKLVDVVRALSDQDERLQSEINKIQLGKGLRTLSKSRGRIDSDETARIIIEGFSNKLRKALFDQVIDKTYNHWDYLYEILRSFRLEHPRRWPKQKESYKGISLGIWCIRQRTHSRKGLLSEERITKLDKLGFAWQPGDGVWELRYEAVCEFRKLHKNRWPKQNEMFQGVSLGTWCNLQRAKFAKHKVPENRVQLLNGIGFDWKPRDTWTQRLEILRAYLKEKRGLWPTDQTVFRGFKIGMWCQNQRGKLRKNLLTADQKAMLKSIGFPTVGKGQWLKRFFTLRAYLQSHKGRWPRTPEAYDGFDIGSWCSHQRVLWRAGRLKKDHEKALQSIDFPFALR